MLVASTPRKRLRGFLSSITAAISISAVVGRFPAAAHNSSPNGLPALRQPTAKPPSPRGNARIGNVFVIIGENTTYDHLNSANAPYQTT
jgi:hypothetical protein